MGLRGGGKGWQRDGNAMAMGWQGDGAGMVTQYQKDAATTAATATAAAVAVSRNFRRCRRQIKRQPCGAFVCAPYGKRSRRGHSGFKKPH